MNHAFAMPPKLSSHEERPAMMYIKKKAHTLTMFSVLWLPFTVFGLAILFHPWSIKDMETLLVGAGILLVHFLLIASAIWCWIKEKKQNVRVFRSEINVDIGGD